MLWRTRSSRATMSMTGTLPPCELMKINLRQPARATLSPISVQARISVSQRKGQRARKFDMFVGFADRLQRQEQHRHIGGHARDRAR